MSKKRKRHTPEQIVKKFCDADAMLNAGQELAVVLQTLKVSEATYQRWSTRKVSTSAFAMSSWRWMNSKIFVRLAI